jgi:5-methylcytosine-specific restriction endonuclease McrA
MIIPSVSSIEELSLYEIEKVRPDYARRLKEDVYSKAIDTDGNYCCAECGKKSATKALFQIDHIVPMSKGGLSVIHNLQLLCRVCNLKKGDR